MIPRIHKRGTSFKTATAYILHDPQAETKERVDWALSLNCGSDEPDRAWEAMYDTWNRRTALKREAGVDLRGADNKRPVMHITLSWAPGETVSKMQMMDAAMESLRAIGLQDHQALIAAHNDKDHQHLHIIVNTVHPETGRTAALKYPALALRDVAREHDRQRAREAADAQMHAARQNRNADLRAKNMALLQPQPIIQTIESAPSLRNHRRRAIQNADIINRMKRHRAEHDHAHMVERDALWAFHRAERDEIFVQSRQAAKVAIDYVRDRFKSRWRDLFEAQRIEMAHVNRIADKPLERAVYVFVNSERLGNGAALSMKQKAALIAQPSELFKAVSRVHTRERRGMANIEKVEIAQRLDNVWRSYKSRYDQMVALQDRDRETIRARQYSENSKDIKYWSAYHELLAERKGRAPPRVAANAPEFETDTGYVRRIRQEIADRYDQGQHEPKPLPPDVSHRRDNIYFDKPEDKDKPKGRDDDFENDM